MYTVTYDSNSASGSVPVDSGSYRQGAMVTVLSAGSLIKTGYSFAGWNTTAGGTGTAYASGSSFTMAAANVILYAQWSPATNTVTFNANNGTGTMVNQTILIGNTAALTTNAFTRTGYSFSGWNTLADGSGTAFANGANYTMGSSSITLYAQWIVGFLVSYNANGGTGVPPVDNAYHAPASAVTVLGAGGLTNTGSFLAGWTTNPASTGASSSYTPGASLVMGSGNLTLYAVWLPNEFWTYSTGTDIVLESILVPTAFVGSFAVPPGVTTIAYAFTGSSGLTSVTIPSSVTTIGMEAFQGCSGLTGVTIPSSVTTIGQQAFCLCYGLTSLVIPSSVTSIGQNAISDCSSLTSIAIPLGVATIGDFAFDSDTGLTSVTFSSSVTTIGSYAFQSCLHLTSVVLPPSVTSIGSDAFNSCQLTSLTMQSSTPPSLPVGSGAFDNEASGFQIHVPSAAAVVAYSNASGWSSYASKMTTP